MTRKALQQHLALILRIRREGAQKPPEGFTYYCAEDYVLDRGRLYDSNPLTSEERKIVLEVAGNRNYEQGACFYNAQILTGMGSQQGFRYVEGFAVGHIIPVIHAWVTFNGKVIDLTWRVDKPCRKGRLGDRILGVIPAGHAYYGVEFDTVDVMERLFKTEIAGPLIDDWNDGWPLYRQPRINPPVLKESR